MRSPERHRDAGAYALGVLDAAEAFRFEDHLMECPRCAAHVTGFGPTTRQLMLYRRATAPFAHTLAQPGPWRLDRLLGEPARLRRLRRWRLGYGLAASVVLAAAGTGSVVFTGHAEPPDPRTTRVASATDPRTGVWARVTSADQEWGSELRVEAGDGAGPPRPRLLVAVGRDGSEQVVAGWSGPGAGGRPVTVLGATALRPDRIARYEVRTARGKVLVTVRGR
ncbi:zf-HC2 domain-containing protein [Streptomyces rubradiris]|uniref:Membrane protein n=1 Tax=Streptomyces rubradiris TaxID=285531 RepID=A0ABQ3RCL2_STRRR|nr:zf-HC2 domain-containing protein [Streptomyces rubradiris]GHG93752.1 membrane protein [Streptomyces rubradiris]GHI53568.1 membrane protein [Streptomyces rubradiris]